MAARGNARGERTQRGSRLEMIWNLAFARITMRCPVLSTYDVPSRFAEQERLEVPK